MKINYSAALSLFCAVTLGIMPVTTADALLNKREANNSTVSSGPNLQPEKSSASSSQNHKANTLTIDGFKNYLNQNFNTITLSCASITFNHEIEKVFIPSYAARYDYWIQTDFQLTLPYELQYSTVYSKEQIKEIKIALCDFQKKIYDEAISYFPNIKFQGGFYHCWYEFPYIQEGFKSRSFLSWVNYDKFYDSFGELGESKITKFHWIPDVDDYNFTDVSNLPSYRMSEEMDRIRQMQ